MPSSDHSELVNTIEDFYQSYSRDEIGSLAQDYPDERSLRIDWQDLYRYDPDLADDFISNPVRAIECAEEALRLYDLPVDITLGRAHVRVHNLREVTDLDSIRAEHVGTLVEVRGTVDSTQQVHSKLKEAAFECQRCGTLTRVPQNPHAERQEPHECQGCERQGPFYINFDQSELIDTQIVHLEQRHTGVGTDEDRESIVVTVEDDIVDSVVPGDTVRITGVVQLDRELDTTNVSIPDKRLEAVAISEADPYSLEVSEADRRRIVDLSEKSDIYEKMVGSLAPTVYGYETEKLAMILQLFSGVTKQLPDGSRIRGNLHVALIGDPGVAKSQLIRNAAQLAPRSVHVSGTNTTAVGLTAAAERTKGGTDTWTFKAGALPKADQGIACVDNITDFGSDELRTLHDVLEEQVIEPSKGSKTVSIPARTSVLAAGNPKYGNYDPYEPMAGQIDLVPGLISQFDLLFVVADEPDEDEDKERAEYILETNYAGELSRQETELDSPDFSDVELSEVTEQVEPVIESDLLRKYVTYARRNCHPRLTDEAKEKIRDFYVDIRANGQDEDVPVPVTARKLEALVRLAEASARIRLSATVESEDAERVIEIVQSSLQAIGLDPESDQFDADVVETGSSKAQRDRIRNIKQLIADIEDDHPKGAPIDVVLERAEEIGMDKSKAEHEIEKLRMQGELYENIEDHFYMT